MKFRNWLMKVMAGRYGGDQLSRALNTATIVFLVLSLFLSRTGAGRVFSTLALLCIAWGTYRILSRNFEKRRRENAVWLRFSGKYLSRYAGSLQGTKQRFDQRKDYKFFRCPSCRTWLRVPRGKGKLNITCRQCGERFTRNT